MGGCVVPLCNNSAVKGYSMMRFPKNEKRRVLWIQNIPEKNWTLSNDCRICEVSIRVPIIITTKCNNYN